MKNNKQWRRTRHFFYKLWRISPDRAVELVLVVLALCFTWAQMHMTYRNNQGNTEQTNQLIGAAKYNAYAADRSAQASQNFASSAQGINNGVQDAVGRLQAQARGTQAIAEASAAQATASRAIADEAATQASAARELARTAQQQLRAAERPWIKTVVRLRPDEAHPSGVWVDEYKAVHVQYQVIAQNVGTYPAIKVYQRSDVVFTMAEAAVERAQEKFCEAPAKQFDIAWEGKGETEFQGETTLFDPYPKQIWPSAISKELDHPSNEVYMTLLGPIKDMSNEGMGGPPTAEEKRFMLPLPSLSITGCLRYTVDHSG